MGWTGGTLIFNAIYENVVSTLMTDIEKKRILKALIQELWNTDWDTEFESAYWTQPIVREAVLELDPDYPYYDELDGDE